VNSGNGYVIVGLACTPGDLPSNITTFNYQNVCAGFPTTLSVSGPGALSWYASPSSTVVLGSGATFVTPTLSAGTYTFYAAASNTCAEGPRVPVTVTVSGSLPVNISANATLVCAGAQLTLTAAGADTYTWSNSSVAPTVVVTPTSNTFYSVMGSSTLSGCTGFSAKSVSVYPSLPLVTAGAGIFCSGTAVDMGASGALSYTWQPGNLTGFFITVFPPVSTVYTVSGTDLYGCVNSATLGINMVICTGVNGFQGSGQETFISPNPGRGEYTIQTPAADYIVEVSDLTGRKVWETRSEGNHTKMDISHLANGLYQVRLIGEREVSVIKVVKQ
jgi:hypothetical protein